MYTCTDAQWAQDGLSREDTRVTLDGLKRNMYKQCNISYLCTLYTLMY